MCIECIEFEVRWTVPCVFVPYLMDFLADLTNSGVMITVSTVHTWVEIVTNPSLCGANFIGANAQWIFSISFLNSVLFGSPGWFYIYSALLWWSSQTRSLRKIYLPSCASIAQTLLSWKENRNHRVRGNAWLDRVFWHRVTGLDGRLVVDPMVQPALPFLRSARHSSILMCKQRCASVCFRIWWPGLNSERQELSFGISAKFPMNHILSACQHKTSD